MKRVLPLSFSGRALALATVFVLSYALALTLSPAVRDLSFDGLNELRWAHWLGVFVWGVSFYWLQRQVARHLPKHDTLLIPLAALLSGWGLLSIWRLTTLFGLRQTVWVAVCSGIFLVLLRKKDELLPTLRSYKYLWLVGGFLITALTFFFGTNPSGIGPRLWLGCCGVYFQPSEPLKLLLIIYLAAYLADRQALIKGLLPLLAPTFLMTGMALLLLIAQRDLGTAWVFILIYMVLIYFATGQRRILAFSLLGIALALFLGYELVPLIELRIEAWLNPWLDPSAGGYQIVQGLLAIAAGGLLGRGPGLGSPGLVPISHSDFIYTSIVEESGLLGAVALLLLVALFVMRALRIALRAEDTFQSYLAVGLSAYLASQSLLIIGGNIRLLPLTGVTLPFVSYGGSSLLTSFFALLLLAIISDGAQDKTQSVSRSAAGLTIASGFLVAFGLAGVVTGWWGYVRAPDLLARPDNVRRAFSEQLVPRGSLLDRNGEVLAFSGGESGSIMRSYSYPQLNSVLGYSNAIYGQTGMESEFDSILRGEETREAGSYLLNEVLYGQPAPGPDLRLSLDVDLQLEAATLFTGEQGAVVLLNAETGEILLMASSPSYDANSLEDDWDEISNMEGSPLLDRASQAGYPPGTALGALIYTAAQMEGVPQTEVGELGYRLGEDDISCLRQPADAEDWYAVIAAACPGPIAELGVALGDEALLNLFSELGLYSEPRLRMESFSQEAPASLSRPGLAAIGQSELLVSPLQMALAASALSNGGQVPAAQIALAVEQGGGDWLELEAIGEAWAVLNSSRAAATAQNLASETLPIWQSAGRAYGEQGQIYSWYLAGTLPGQTSESESFTIVVLLEKDEAALARSIGQRLLLASINK